MGCTSGRRGMRKAFTLIELLVVVAIIAVLISILLPSLRDAREQAKIAKCLSNLRGLMTATTLYFQDYNDEFPLWMKKGGGTLGICSWLYGGKTSEEYWQTFYGGVFYVPVTERPLNRYLMGGRVEDDTRKGEQIVQRTEIPPLQCPSDRFSHQRFWLDDMDVPISSYDDIGTSYQQNINTIQDMNIHWSGPGYSGQNCRTLVRQMLRDVFKTQASTLTFFYEDPMDFSFKDMTLQVGNHMKLARHSAGYLDGHAEHRHYDTRSWCGIGWQAINRAWVWREGQEAPPFHYDAGKDCEPPQ